MTYAGGWNISDLICGPHPFERRKEPEDPLQKLQIICYPSYYQKNRECQICPVMLFQTELHAV